MGFYSNVERLCYAGFKIVGETKEDVKTQYEKYVSKVEAIKTGLEEIQMNIEKNKSMIEVCNYKKEKAEAHMQKMREKSFFVIFSSSYKYKKRKIKELENQKNLYKQKIKAQYEKLKKEQKKYDNAKSELRNFERFANKMAKKYAQEIKFILYCKNNMYKLEKAYSKEQIKDLKKYMNRLRKGEKGFEEMTVQQCFEQVKNAVKSQRPRLPFWNKNKNQPQPIIEFGPKKVQVSLEKKDNNQRKNNSQKKDNNQEKNNNQRKDNNQIENNQDKKNDKILNFKEEREKIFRKRMKSEAIENSSNKDENSQQTEHETKTEDSKLIER